MQQSMDHLSLVIKSQIELYEEQMSNAMAEGNEEDMRKINDDFENEVGKNVCAFAKMAGEPLKSTLIALFSDSCADR
jgi:NADH:ubiquinone oxidoreductase subunit F (NADH-binding)